jgi:solute carrier family 30 (zinc transporter), member 1
VRAEVLGPLINSVFLMSLCLGIIIEAIERIFDRESIQDIDLLLIVGCIGLGINLLGLFIFGHGHSHSMPPVNQYLDEEDENERTNLIESMPDEMIRAANINNITSNNENITNGGYSSDMKNELDFDIKNPVQEKKNEPAKKTKKKKKTRCHILCNSTSLFIISYIFNICFNPFNMNFILYFIASEANMNIRAVFLHVLADALGSVIVIISALLNKYQKELKINQDAILLIDPILCLALVALILGATIPLCMFTIRIKKRIIKAVVIIITYAIYKIS